MKHLSSFKLFESSDAEIEMFEDMLQEYFDQYKIYPKNEVDSQGMYGSTTPNGDYEIKRVSTYFFKVPGFPNHAKGIHIKVHLWKHDALREDLAKGLTKFIYRIKKMGYETDAAYDDSFGVNFHISILDKKVEESFRYLNKNFEVSEDDFLDWTYDHQLDEEGFSKREEIDINRWATNGFERKQHRLHHNRQAQVVFNKSLAELYDGYEKIDICKYEDEWFTLFIEDKYENPIYHIFDNWEDLKETVNSHLNNYFNYYDEQNVIEDEENQNESKSQNLEVCKSLTRTEFDDFYENHPTENFTELELEQITQILSETYDKVEPWVFRKNDQPTDHAFFYFDDKEINIHKFEDSWFLIEEMWSNSWNKDPHYYLCDEIDSIKYIDFYA